MIDDTDMLHVLQLFIRIFTQEPVWVDSPMGQRTTITGLSFDNRGGFLAMYDADGNDRPPNNYLLTNPNRAKS